MSVNEFSYPFRAQDRVLISYSRGVAAGLN
jgi:hypothetical protein